MMKKVIPFLLLLGLLLLIRNRLKGAAAVGSLAKSYLGVEGVHKGISNNNPLNLRISSNNWKGKIPKSENTDGAFEQFRDWVSGVRAGILNLRTHYNRGNTTISKLLYIWAPPSDGNDTAAYIEFVSSRAGIGSTVPFVWGKDIVGRIIRAMAHMETGVDIVTESDFEAAWQSL